MTDFPNLNQYQLYSLALIHRKFSFIKSFIVNVLCSTVLWNPPITDSPIENGPIVCSIYLDLSSFGFLSCGFEVLQPKAFTAGQIESDQSGSTLAVMNDNYEVP